MGLNFLKLTQDGKVDNKELIIKYLVEPEGSIELTVYQKELLDRWSTADDLMRMYKRMGYVEEMLIKKFEYSIATARNDIYDARTIFGATRPNNKKYRLQVHSDFLLEQILLAAKDKNFKAVAMLSREYTNAIKALPDDDKKTAPPAVIIFQLPEGVIPGMNEQEAKQVLLDQGFTDIEEV